MKEIIIRPDIRDKHGKKRRELCKYCVGSCRVNSPDKTIVNLVCATKSWRQNEVIILSEGALAEDCRSFTWRPPKSIMKRYKSHKELLESPVTRLTDFFRQPGEYGKPAKPVKYGGRY